MPLKTVILATTVNEEEDIQFDVNLSSEIGKSSAKVSSVSSEVFEESPEPMDQHELSSLLDLKSGIEGSREHGRDRCAAFSTRGRVSKANCVIDTK